MGDGRCSKHRDSQCCKDRRRTVLLNTMRGLPNDVNSTSSRMSITGFVESAAIDAEINRLTNTTRCARARRRSNGFAPRMKDQVTDATVEHLNDIDVRTQDWDLPTAPCTSATHGVSMTERHARGEVARASANRLVQIDLVLPSLGIRTAVLCHDH